MDGRVPLPPRCRAAWLGVGSGAFFLLSLAWAVWAVWRMPVGYHGGGTVSFSFERNHSSLSRVFVPTGVYLHDRRIGDVTHTPHGFRVAAEYQEASGPVGRDKKAPSYQDEIEIEFALPGGSTVRVPWRAILEGPFERHFENVTGLDGENEPPPSSGPSP